MEAGVSLTEKTMEKTREGVAVIGEKTGDSLGSVREAVARDPQHSLALDELATELEKQGKFAQALPLYRRGLELEQKKLPDAVVWPRPKYEVSTFE